MMAAVQRYEGTVAEVQMLLILRSHRRHGIGQALTTAVEEAARQ